MIYVSGTSNGGNMSIRLAQELPNKIAVFAAISASNAVNSQCVESSVPVSALFINGTEDPLLPYEGGQIAEDQEENRGEVFPAEETVNYWVKRNQTIPIETAITDSFHEDESTVTNYQ